MSNNPAPSLKVLAEAKTDGITKSTSFRVDPELIRLQEGFNLRTENDELELHIQRIADAMLAGAFIPPVDVQVIDGVIVARDGHCRTRAALIVKQSMPEYTLECRQLRGNEAEAVLHMLGTGSGQKALTPLEQGRGYLRLLNMGLTPAAIAGRLGVTPTTIGNGLALAEAPVELQRMVENGEVSSTTAREAVKQGADGVAALTEAVKEERANPTPRKKNGKKKKVTPKKLRAKKAKSEPEPETVQSPPAPPRPDEITFSVTKAVATATLEFLKCYAEDSAIMPMVSALEMGLL